MTHQRKYSGTAASPVPPLLQRGLLEREFSLRVAEAGRPLISRSAEVRFYSGVPPCMLTTAGPKATEATLSDLRQRVADCGGQVTYVVEELSQQGLGDTRQQATDSYVVEHFEPILQKAHRDYRISLFLIEDAIFDTLTEEEAL